jgi:predicted component of type VI protein secretion system
MMPAFAAHQGAIGYLEPLENAPGHTDNIPITAGNMAIGRDPKLVQIQFAHKSVSRLHARIIEKGGVFQLYDEGSASGTYINYEQVSLQPQRLNDNDDIHFGQVHVRFHVTGDVDDSDSTQVMPSPMQPGRPQPSAPAVDDDMSTQPYMPNQPPGAGGGYVQPPDSDDDDDEDDLSTQPYMPHQPR